MYSNMILEIKTIGQNMVGTSTVKFPWRTMKTSITNIMKRYFSKSYKHTYTHTQ